MILKQEDDSIFISADTLYSAKLSDLRKYRNVPLIIDTAALPKIDSSVAKNDSTDRFLKHIIM